MNEDFFKVMIFPRPVISIQHFGITAINLTIQLPAVVSLIISISVRGTILPLPPNITLRQVLFLVPQEPVCAFELFHCDIPIFTSSYIIQYFFFSIVGTPEEPGVRGIFAHDNSDMVLPPLMLMAGKKKNKAPLSAAQG